MKKQRRIKDELARGLMPADELARAIAKAEADRIDPREMPIILARHQQGDAEATRRLVDGFMFLVWNAYQHFTPLPGDQRVSRLDMVTTWAFDLATVIANLDLDATPSDVERKIRGALAWSHTNYLEEIASQLNATAHLSNEAKATGSMVTERKLRTGEIVNLLDDPEARLPVFTPEGEVYRVPSRYEQPMPDQEAEDADEAEAERRAREAEAKRLAPYARTAFEAAVVDGHRAGTPLPNVPHTRIEQALARLRDRAA